ncbi:MAG: polysaccharide biosynthesis tyrosine autokinase [Kofleriaceae bacterium]|nr:polysaccharide biosynthesis tyrosine autokinase [Kofleriaceae bacterium]
MRDDTDFAREDEEEGGIDIRHFVDIVLKRKWLVMAAMAVGITLAVLYTMRQTPLYKATASVEVNPQAPQVFGRDQQEVVQLGSGNYWSSQEYYNTQLEILRSRSLARITVLQHDLHNDTRLVPESPKKKLTEEQRIEKASRSLRAAVTVTRKRDSRIILISITHPDAELAADLANMHADSYQHNNVQVQKGGTGIAAKFLAREVDTAEKSLTDSEAALVAFRDENEILHITLDGKAIEDRQNMLSANLTRYNSALSDARIKRIELEGLRRQAAHALKKDEILESAIFGLVGNSTVNILKEQYLREQQVFIDLRTTLGPKNPGFIAQKKKVADIYKAIQREGRLALSEIEERLGAVRNNEGRLVAELKGFKEEAKLLGSKTGVYNKLLRQNSEDKENYAMLRDRLRTSNLSLKNDASNNIRSHDVAQVPAAPFSPRMPVNVAVAAVMSLLLGIGLVFLLEYLDRTVKTAEDVVLAAKTPMLGLIPVLHDISDSSSDLQERDLYIFNKPKPRAAECCRSIRTNLLFSAADRDLTILTVSSPNPQEGKTTSVIYLGTTMAQSGQRVLLVDTDMRRPRLHKSMGVSRGKGISNLIVGDSSYEDCIKSTDVPNLFVLPCGPTPPNPAELLLTDRFKSIIEELRGKFDRVIFDTPPLQAVTDGVVLAKLSDGAIMVVKAGQTNREALTASSKMWRDVGVHQLGVILNDIDLNDKKYGYNYYAYGYGETAAEAAE